MRNNYIIMQYQSCSKDYFLVYLHHRRYKSMSSVIPRLRDNYKKSDRRKEKQMLYNDTLYRKERDWYMMCHPLCECCERDGLITQAVHCHHIQSPFQIGISKEEAYRRLRDPNNFIALCRVCHLIQHGLASKEMLEEREKRIQNLKDNKDE